jgi:hypothetical protein
VVFGINNHYFPKRFDGNTLIFVGTDFLIIILKITDLCCLSSYQKNEWANPENFPTEKCSFSLPSTSHASFPPPQFHFSHHSVNAPGSFRFLPEIRTSSLSL